MFEGKITGEPVATEPGRNEPVRRGSTATRAWLGGIGLVAVLLVSTVGPLAAQEAAPLVTDRPTAATSTSIVARGAVLWEMGSKFSRDDADGVRDDSADLFDSLLRIGLYERVELRIGWLSYASKESSGAAGSTDVSGTGDGALSAKIRLRSEKGAWPELALLVGTTLPIGADAFTSDEPDPFVALASSHGFSDRLGLVYNVGLDSVTRTRDQRDHRDLDLTYSGALSITHGPRLASFVEAFGETAVEGPRSTSVSVGGGVTYLVRPNLQLDASGGAGLSGSATDWFVSAGLSVRFPR